MTAPPPAVAAAASGGAGEGGDRPAGIRTQLHAWMSEKATVEARMAEANTVLQRHGVSMHDPLVDGDDYPRADIDVYAVRHARATLRRLQTDHRQLMLNIEHGLEQLHSQARHTDAAAPAEQLHHPQPAPVLHVTSVTAGSPAESAGLRPGDQLTMLGSVTAANYSSMSDVAAVVHHSRDRPLRVQLLRQGRQLSLLLTPRLWAGPGTLGCQLQPADHPER